MWTLLRRPWNAVCRNARDVIAPKPEEFQALTGVRALACLWIVAFHTAQMTGMGLTSELRDAHASMRDHWSLRVVVMGMSAVDVFFVLTGFLLAYPYFRKEFSVNERIKALPTASAHAAGLTEADGVTLRYQTTAFTSVRVRRYWYKRFVVRLYPSFVVAALVYCKVLIGSFDFARVGVSAREFALTLNPATPALATGGCQWIGVNMLFVNNLVPLGGCMNWTWSLAVQGQFYFVFPLLLRATKNVRNFVALCGVWLGVSLAWRTGAVLLNWDTFQQWPSMPFLSLSDWQHYYRWWMVMYTPTSARIGTIIAGVLFAYVQARLYIHYTYGGGGTGAPGTGGTPRVPPARLVNASPLIGGQPLTPMAPINPGMRALPLNATPIERSLVDHTAAAAAAAATRPAVTTDASGSPILGTSSLATGLPPMSPGTPDDRTPSPAPSPLRAPNPSKLIASLNFLSAADPVMRARHRSSASTGAFGFGAGSSHGGSGAGVGRGPGRSSSFNGTTLHEYSRLSDSIPDSTSVVTAAAVSITAPEAAPAPAAPAPATESDALPSVTMLPPSTASALLGTRATELLPPVTSSPSVSPALTPAQPSARLQHSFRAAADAAAAARQALAESATKGVNCVRALRVLQNLPWPAHAVLVVLALRVVARATMWGGRIGPTSGYGGSAGEPVGLWFWVIEFVGGPACAAAIVWLMFIAVNEVSRVGIWLNRFLSLSIWRSVSKLSYSVFLLHPALIFKSYITDHWFYPIPQSVAFVWFAIAFHMLLVFALAFALYVTVERPVTDALEALFYARNNPMSPRSPLFTVRPQRTISAHRL